MNKNPFIPQPSFGHTQPPLPPGPPPQQPDYNAYWSAAAAVQQPPAGQPAYNPHFAASGWTAPQPAPPAKPPADQSSLYANYGYGGQQNIHWQQRPGHPPRPPQMTMVQSAPATYHPYQQQTQQAPYPPPGFMPQPGMPQPMAQQPYRPVQPPQPPYIAQPHPLPPRQPSMNHSSPQQLPPAKRQRFDHSQNAPQPRFQAPPPPPSLPQQPAAQGRSGQPGFGALPTGPSNSFGSGRGGGMGGGRGGPGRGRGAIGGNRGGLVRGGRGGSMYGGGRGGNRNQGGAGLRGHQSRDRNNFENFNRGRGASFSGSFHGNGSFRSHGRSGGSGSNRNARNENHGSKLINSSSSVGNPANKKDENRRTLTDFKLVGLEIQNLDWRWGHVPSDPGTSQTKNVQVEEDPSSLIKEEPETDSKLPSMDTDERTPGSGLAHLNNLFSSSSLSATSRLRIYFHTLPSPDDARLSLQSSPMADTRKGKRKKLDDDGDGDYDGLPSFPLLNETEGGHHDSSASVDNNAGGLERGSAAPSVTETASEADWLMAAIAEGNDDGDEHYDDEHQSDGEHPHDGEMVDDDQMSEIAATQADEPPLEGERKEPDGDVHAAESQETEMGLEDADGEPDPEHMPEGETGSQEIPGLTRADDHTVNQSESHSQSEVIPGLSPILPADIDETQSEREHKSGSPTTHPLVAEPTLVLSENEPEIKVEDFTFASQNAEGSVHSPPGESGAGEKSDRPVDESLPEPPDSTSTSNTSAHNAESANPPAAAATRQPSANRLSISYANGLRRLVIDADIVEKMQVFRAESRIEVAMTIERVSDGFKGILVEALNEETKSYVAIQDLSEALESDDTLPPFWCFVFPTKTNLVVYLDKQRRLSEAKWVRSGDVQDWLKSMFGRMFWVAGDAVGWEKKIEVVDPEPTPTIQTVLEGWSSVSPVGSLTERQRFVKTHLSESENTLEILLRLVRGERATPFSSQTTATANTLGFTGPLQNALNLSTHHASQQTHVSLAVLAIVKMALDFAEKTVETNEKAKGDVMERMGEIIKSLPSHLLYKSLDGMFKEWKADKKGGR